MADLVRAPIDVTPLLAAARWVMDELKRSVPIWKKEHFDGGGAQWVEGHPLA